MHDVASMKKEVSAENSSSEAKVGELNNNGSGIVSTTPILNKSFKEVVQKQVSEDAVPPVVGPPTDSLLSSVPNSSYPSVPSISQTTTPEALQVKRQGRKAVTRAEVPRRRGKKQGPVSPAVDASIGQDPDINSPMQNKSRDLLGSKSMSLRTRQENELKESKNVVQVHHILF